MKFVGAYSKGHGARDALNLAGSATAGDQDGFAAAVLETPENHAHNWRTGTWQLAHLSLL